MLYSVFLYILGGLSYATGLILFTYLPKRNGRTLLFLFLASLSITCITETFRLYRPGDFTEMAEFVALTSRVFRRPLVLHLAIIFFEPKLANKKRLLLIYLPVALLYVPGLILVPGDAFSTTCIHRAFESLPLLYSLVSVLLFLTRSLTSKSRARRLSFLHASLAVGLLIVTDVMTFLGIISIVRWMHALDVVPLLLVVSLLMLYLQTPPQARAEGFIVAPKKDSFSISLCFSLSMLYFAFSFFGFGYNYFAIKQSLQTAFKLPIFLIASSFVLACLNNSSLTMRKKEWISGVVCAFFAPISLLLMPGTDTVLILTFSMFQLLFFVFLRDPLPLWVIGIATTVTIVRHIFTSAYPINLHVKIGDLLSVMVVFLCIFFFILYFNRRYAKHVKNEKQQLELQDMVMGMAVTYTNVHSKDMDENISRLLATAAQLPGIDRALLWLVQPEGAGLDLTQEWYRDDLEPLVGFFPPIYVDRTKRFYHALLANEVIEVFAENFGELYQNVDYNPYDRAKTGSILSIPLMADAASINILAALAGGKMNEGYGSIYDYNQDTRPGETKMMGIISLHSRQKGFGWNDNHRHLLHMLASTVLHVCIKAQSERSLYRVAYYDHLTGLPNRYYLNRELKQRLKSQKEKGGQFAVALIDLDSFKYINDTAGHATGDEVLRQVASRLQGMMRLGDMVFRFGGDEFVLIFDGLKGSTRAQELITLALHALEEPIVCGGQSFFVTASAGVAMAPVDGDHHDTLLKHADMTMYSAKLQGKNRFALCTPEIKQSMIEEGMLINHLNYAIEKEQLYLCYQPVIRLSDGKIVAFEALCRWNLPGVGNISPTRFIPLAEQSFHINRIGEFVLRTAAQEFKQWLDEGVCEGQICVNFSMQQFQDVHLSAFISSVLQDSGLSPDRLVMEITESVEGSQTVRIENILLQLHEKGISVAMDDFGTRFSSFNRLKNLPLQCIKIDMQFIRGMIECEKDRGVIKAMIALSKSLGMTLVAEGVETREQLELLRSWGCDRAQGYYISKPLPKEAVRSFIRDYPQGLGTIFQ